MENCENNRYYKLSEKIKKIKHTFHDNRLFCREFMSIKDEIMSCLCYLAEKNCTNSCWHCKSINNENYIFLITGVSKISERCMGESCGSGSGIEIFESIYDRLVKVLESCRPKEKKKCRCRKGSKVVKVIIVNDDECGSKDKCSNKCECRNESKVNECSNQGVCKLNDNFEHKNEYDKYLRYDVQHDNKQFNSYEKEEIKSGMLYEEVKKDNAYQIKEKFEEYENYNNYKNIGEQRPVMYQQNYLEENENRYEYRYEEDDDDGDDYEYNKYEDDDDRGFSFNVFPETRSTWR